MPERIKTDIAVVGAGGCGLTASLIAASRGKQVLLLERTHEVGGSTAMSAGIIVAAGSQLQRANGELGTAEELADDIFALNSGQSDPEVTMALCRASGALIDWLVTQGVPLEHMPNYRYAGMSRAWMLSTPQRLGAVMTVALHRKVQENPHIEIHLGAQVTGLLVDNGAVRGLGAIMPGEETFAVSAQSVILAASGFGANASLVRRYIPELAGVPYFGAPYVMGNAIEWGESIGAAMDHMGAYQSHSSIAHPRMMLVTTYLINHGAIQVNQDGRRFGDETDSYAGHALMVQAQPGRSVVELFDEHILQQTLVDYPRFTECLEAGIVYRAGSLEKMAKQFGLAKSNLETTVEKYNSSTTTGVDEFGRTRYGGPLIPPFYGIRVTSALVQTLGGLRVDARGRVLRPDGARVPGLYAGGGTAAGLAGERSEGYMAGTGLLTAFGLGMLAGLDATRR